MRSTSTRWAASVVAFVLIGACTPAGLDGRAATTLGRRLKHIDLVDDGVIGDTHVYTYCSHERHHDVGNLVPVGARNFDAACVMYLCRPGDTGKTCEESRW